MRGHSTRRLAATGLVGALLGALLLGAPGAPALLAGGTDAAGRPAPAAELALAAAVTRARETCYAAPDCPNLEELMALFTAAPRRTEIQRPGTVVLLEGAEALREDHLRVARQFPGRRLETVSLVAHGRNVIALQRNVNPGSPERDAFTSVFRIEDGKVAHWILIAP
jgi:hypothetical protein